MPIHWLHPGLLLGALAAGIPIVLHLIGRQRAPNVQFAAFDFLVAMNKRMARRERIRQFLLLLIRVLMVLFLVVALSRPVPYQAVASEIQTRTAILIIDTSSSMRYVQRGRPLIEHAKERAFEIISQLKRGDKLGLLVAGNTLNSELLIPTTEYSTIENVIEGLEITKGTSQMGKAIQLALSQLNDEKGQLILVSDLAANSFRDLQQSSFSAEVALELVDAANREVLLPLSNLAIESLTIKPGANSFLDRDFQIRIRNFGKEEIEQLAIEFVVDEQVEQRGFLNLRSGDVSLKLMHHSFDKPGCYKGKIRLVSPEADGYIFDDEVTFLIKIAEPIRVLAVNGDRRTIPHEDELFFVERALTTFPQGESAIELMIVGEDEFNGLDRIFHSRESFDVILLANVGTISEQAIDIVNGFLQQGGGLFISLGREIEFERLNREWASFLPHPLRDFHQIADKISHQPAVNIDYFDSMHPVFVGLGHDFEQSLRVSETSGYFHLETGGSQKMRTLIRFNNGAPALIESQNQTKGKVALLTTSIDLGLSNLALQSGFPVLLQRLIRYLANGVLDLSEMQVRERTAFELPIPLGVRGVSLTSPNGLRSEIEVSSVQSSLNVPGLDEIGIYKVEVLRNEWVRNKWLDVAINSRLSESDFRPIQTGEVAAALKSEGKKPSISLLSGGQTHSSPSLARGFASWFLIFLATFFAGECFLASRG